MPVPFFSVIATAFFLLITGGVCAGADVLGPGIHTIGAGESAVVESSGGTVHASVSVEGDHLVVSIEFASGPGEERLSSRLPLLDGQRHRIVMRAQEGDEPGLVISLTRRGDMLDLTAGDWQLSEPKVLRA